MFIRKIHYRVMIPAVALGILLGGVAANFGQTAGSGLFSPSTMEEVSVDGLRVRLGQPIQVTAQIGWEVGWPQFMGKRAFTHITPALARFPQGELIATYTLDPDTQSNPVFVSGFQISKDGGAHWGRRYSLLMQHITVIFLPKPDDSLMALPSEMFQETPGDEHNFRGPYYLFEHGGDRMVMVPDGIRVVDWPWPAEVYSSPQPRENWHAGVILTGNALSINGKMLATGYFQKKGEKTTSAVILSSTDGGYTWRYLSTVAGPDPTLVSQRSYEGADEMSMIQLADGDLMAVFRVGSGRKWNLRRAYSHDEGHTWSKPDVLPAWSVDPQLVRTASGTIALSTGRPGISLWLSTDPQGTNWKQFDIAAHHNRCVTDPRQRINSFEINPSPYLSETTRWQTSSYTGLVEVAPNRLILLYDRVPEGPPVDDHDLSRAYVLPIELEPGSNSGNKP